LILSKMVTIVATRCHILRLKCPKFDFGWGSAPDPLEELRHSTPPDILAGILGVLLIREGKGKEGRGWEWEGNDRGGRKGKVEGKGEPGEGKERREGEWRG